MAATLEAAHSADAIARGSEEIAEDDRGCVENNPALGIVTRGSRSKKGRSGEMKLGSGAGGNEEEEVQREGDWSLIYPLVPKMHYAFTHTHIHTHTYVHTYVHIHTYILCISCYIE